MNYKNMNTAKFRGCGTALITPFRNGEVDYEAYAALVDRQVAGGVDFLVPLGTTGETPCLSDEEKVKVLQLTKKHAAGLPLVVGAGTNSLEHTIENIKLLEPHGVDAFLVVVPYYNKPPQEGNYVALDAVLSSAIILHSAWFLSLVIILHLVYDLYQAVYYITLGVGICPRELL